MTICLVRKNSHILLIYYLCYYANKCIFSQSEKYLCLANGILAIHLSARELFPALIIRSKEFDRNKRSAEFPDCSPVAKHAPQMECNIFLRKIFDY